MAYRNKPLTPEQAVALFGDSTIDQTCSMQCEECSKVVYFAGSRVEAPYSYQCPHCSGFSDNILVSRLKQEKRRLEKTITSLEERLRNARQIHN